MRKKKVLIARVWLLNLKRKDGLWTSLSIHNLQDLLDVLRTPFIDGSRGLRDQQWLKEPKAFLEHLLGAMAVIQV